jgi:nucleoside-diphosphate-sugar epimerase
MDVLHVCDAVDAILHVAKFDEGRWRIGSLETFQIRDIVDLVSSATGKHLHVNYDRSIDRELDQFSSWHQGEVLPGFKRKIDFEDWITRAVFNN